MWFMLAICFVFVVGVVTGLNGITAVLWLCALIVLAALILLGFVFVNGGRMRGPDLDTDVGGSPREWLRKQNEEAWNKEQQRGFDENNEPRYRDEAAANRYWTHDPRSDRGNTPNG